MAEAQDQEDGPDGSDQIPEKAYPPAPSPRKLEAEDQRKPSFKGRHEQKYARFRGPDQGHVVINQGAVGQQFVGNNMRFGSYTSIGNYKERKSAPETQGQMRGAMPASAFKDSLEGAASGPLKVFISYCHKDARWLKRLQVHLRPLEQKGLIDLWDDTKIATGNPWLRDLQQALESAAVAITLVSPDFLASDFITRYELPKLLSQARAGGTLIIPLVVAPCLFEASELSLFQAANDPKEPLVSLTVSRREQVFVHVGQIIRKRLASTLKRNDETESSSQKPSDRL
jgi:hypothetical protein